MSDLVYLNGEYVPAAQASISILDRGFMFGDGVYEVIPVYGGKLFRLAQHLERLQRSIEAIHMQNPMQDSAWAGILNQLIEKNTGDQDAYIYLQVTRGVMQKRDHAYSSELVPTVLVMCQPYEYAVQTKESKGIKAITLEDNRWADCHIKSINLLPNAMLKQQAIDQGATEAILISEGFAIEGSASNLFIVKDDVIRTPRKGRNMLGGVTRDLIAELCAANKIIVQNMSIREDELHDADEIWMTSSTKEIMPVTTLNQHKVGKGIPGPRWLEVMELYQDYKQSVMQA